MGVFDRDRVGSSVTRSLVGEGLSLTTVALNSGALGVLSGDDVSVPMHYCSIASATLATNMI